ncbi:two-component system histidine kinase PnpS [Staphylospora marina]|uniref:two-component system histidine kinase PnpS n=1 Tax=Staphylospora marina TaxID=2490858 RepID=UPI000F5BB8BE|nr:ATP-binding protein [Staphylospora marina]
MRSLRTRITGSILFLIGGAVLGTGIFVALLLKTSYIDSLTERLEKEGKLLAETVDWSASAKPGELTGKAEVYGRALGLRVALFDSAGNNLGDSTGVAHPGANPEVRKALDTGKPVPSVYRNEALHTAVPVIRDGRVVGAVWLTKSLTEVNRSLGQVWFSLILGLIIAYGIAGFAGSRIAGRVTRSLEEITQVAVDMAQKRLYRRVAVNGDDEVASLGRAINRMAYSLQQQVEELRRSERRLGSVIETMESGLLMVDATGRIRLANRAFEKMFGIPASDLRGKSFERLTHPYDLAVLIKECAESGLQMRREIHLYYPEERMLQAHLSPMWAEKSGIGVVVVFHDLTAIRRLEQLRRDFVANVSHELKTPVTSIRGFAETLLDGAMEDTRTLREFLTIILEESLRLERLVGDLLDLSRIESKQFRLELETVQVDELVRGAVKTMEDRIRAKGQTLTVEIPETFQAEVDVDRVRQILLNLLSNAMVYTPEGGAIRVRAERGDGDWILSVEDTGVGIPPEDLPRIFERFYRVDKARARHSGGTGLGLAIVKHLVEAHRGKLEVKSRLGEGTMFIMRFPLNQ